MQNDVTSAAILAPNNTNYEDIQQRNTR